MENFLTEVFRLEDENPFDPFDQAILETEQAIMRIRSGEDMVILAPQAAPIRKHQHNLARKNQLHSESHGKDQTRHVRIFADEYAS
jgi:hypothetical protein